MQIKTKLNEMRQEDIYSMSLFILYKLQDTAEYSALSELAYILDKKNLLKLCEYFGGCTITIPTVDELENVIHALMLYKYIDVDKIEYDEAISMVSDKSNDMRSVKSIYSKLHPILMNYNFYSGE